MRKTRGLRLGRKVVKLWKWLLKPKRKPSTAGYLRLSTSNLTKTRTMTKICNWGRRLTQSLRPPLLRASSYSRIDQTPLDEKPVQVPKGHLAVYVGQKDGDPHRFLVPIIYFNHPLFGQLLREAEEEYGFHHPGGITIPCQISEFESVQMKIAGESCRRRRRSLLGGQCIRGPCRNVSIFSTLRGIRKGHASYTMHLAKFDIVPQYIKNQLAT